MNKIENCVAEYGSTLGKHAQRSGDEWLNIERMLVSEHEWTEQAAACLVWLVREYGSFVLGNAYALAVVLGIEAGEAGL
ncbi:MAG: hypothetical protein LLF76_09320 [Planctomycetaceae bacterium]|nr:hypothetical protein [Planctomycetaceae bacterium]